MRRQLVDHPIIGPVLGSQSKLVKGAFLAQQYTWPQLHALEQRYGCRSRVFE
jgi:hypothetical protein